MRNTLVIIQARLGSKRLPSKILMPLLGKPMIEQVFIRAERAGGFTIIASPREEEAELKEALPYLPLFFPKEASSNDVLSRFMECTLEYPQYKRIVRITGDCPLVDSDLIKKAVNYFKGYSEKNCFNYLITNNIDNPRGFEVEIFNWRVLIPCHAKAEGNDREHVCTWMRNFYWQYYKWQSGLNPAVNYSVDSQKDYEHVKAIYEHFGHNEFSIQDIERSGL